MTNTLTEQWRAGNLKKSFYYLKFPDTETAEIYNLYDMEKFRYVQDSEKIEVLDEVPSYVQYIGLVDDSKELDKAYDKINLLEKKLAIATKALEEYSETETYDWIDSQVVAIQALKEIEEVK